MGQAVQAEADRPPGVRLPTFGGDGPADGVDLADLGQIKEIFTTNKDAAYRSGTSGSSPEASFRLE